MLSLKSKYRTHTCGELTEKNVGETVTLSGWVHRKRDHGSLLFVDLRDNYGITQIVFDGGNEELERVHPESVIQIVGKVVARDADQVNDKIPTGHIEIQAESWKVLTSADALPWVTWLQSIIKGTPSTRIITLEGQKSPWQTLLCTGIPSRRA